MKTNATRTLDLEFRNEFCKAKDTFMVNGHIIMGTPPIDEDYWVFRIKLSKYQSIVAFPKFWTMGIGFAKETNWNTNLPYDCDAEKIYNWIKRNKIYKSITKEKCIEAINILKRACAYYMVHEKASEKLAGLDEFKSYTERLKKHIESKGEIDAVNYSEFKKKLPTILNQRRRR
jgi:hypothetical protein